MQKHIFYLILAYFLGIVAWRLSVSNKIIVAHCCSLLLILCIEAILIGEWLYGDNFKLLAFVVEISYSSFDTILTIGSSVQDKCVQFCSVILPPLSTIGTHFSRIFPHISTFSGYFNLFFKKIEGCWGNFIFITLPTFHIILAFGNWWDEGSGNICKENSFVSGWKFRL